MPILSSVIAISLFRVGAAAVLLTFSAKALYRLFFHPLANVPGPKIAALTGLYEFLWDCPMKGRYIFKVQEMHEKYGPIVRINPREVHIRDPSYFDVLYSNNQKINKDEWFYRMFGNSPATFATGPSDIHRLRRGAMNKSFSTAAIDRLEPRMVEKVKKLLYRLGTAQRSGEVVNVSAAQRALAMDIISEYVVPQPRNYLDEPDFGYEMQRSLLSATSLSNWARHMPFVVPIFQKLPRFLTPILDSQATDDTFLDHFERLAKDAEAVVRSDRTKERKDCSLLEAVYTSPLLPESERTYERILAEAHGVIGAGVDSVAGVAVMFIFQMLRNPDRMAKLKAEVRDGIQTDDDEIIPSRTLGKLQYLQAAIKEALRLAPAVSARLPRINPTAPMVYTSSNTASTYTFPPGTVISMNIMDMLMDPSVFPQPERFTPERWFDADAECRQRMENSFVPFSKGSRNCLGMELAKRQLTLILGNLFRQYDMELFETTERDVSIAHDLFGPIPPADSRSVRVKVR